MLSSRSSAPLQLSASSLISQSPAFRAVQCSRRRRASGLVSLVSGLHKQMDVQELQQTKLITAIKTPYELNGRIDLPAFDRHVDNQIGSGVDGLIIGGTTGEGQLMSWDEHIMLIAHTVNKYGDKICVIGNTGSNSTREAVHATRQGFAVGMHAALQINPYYGKTSVTGLVRHFEECLEQGPAILYNVPSRTGQDIPEDVVLHLAKLKNFLGVKECTGNERIQRYSDKGICTWSGNDDEAHDSVHNHGANGVISVTSNIVPGLFAKMMADRDDDTNASLQELMSWMFEEPNPIAVNTTMAMCGLARPVFRLPYVPLSMQQREAGKKLLDPFLEQISGAEAIRVMDDDEFKLLSSF